MPRSILSEDWMQYGLRKFMLDVGQKHRWPESREAMWQVDQLTRTIFPRQDWTERLHCQKVARAFRIAKLTAKQAAVVEGTIRGLTDKELVDALNECLGGAGARIATRYTENAIRQIRFRALSKLRAKEEGSESIRWLMGCAGLSDIRRGRPEKRTRSDVVQAETRRAGLCFM